MKRNIILICGLGMALVSLISCGEHNHEGHGDEAAEAQHGHEGHDHVKSEGHRDESGLIILEHEQIEQLGISSREVKAGDFSNVIKVSGEITLRPDASGVVAARQAGIVRLSKGISAGMEVSAGRSIASVSAGAMAGGDPSEAARVAYNAARRELDRITPLHNEGIISTRDYNAALQRVEETRAALGGGSTGATSAAVAPVSGVITSVDVVDGQYVDAGQTIATVSSNNALVLRADLPEAEASMLAEISGAKFRPSYSRTLTDVEEAGGHILSKSSVTSNGYIPVYFTLPRTDAGLIGGTYCEVYLTGQKRGGVMSVDEAAISEQQGKYFVYVEVMPGHFRKQPVSVGSTDGEHREILSGLKEGDKVVTDGMTYIRLAESSGVVPEGHSHNH